MAQTTQRTLLYGAMVAAAIAAFAAARSWPGLEPFRWIPACVGVLAVAMFAARSDEVARLVALKAAGLAFVVALAAALALPMIASDSGMALARDWAWAGLMTAWMTGWVLFRVRLG